MTLGIFFYLANAIVVLAFIVRVMTRPHREPVSRIAWVAVIAALPVVGIIAYLLLGETSIGTKRINRMKGVIEGLPPMAEIAHVNH